MPTELSNNRHAMGRLLKGHPGLGEEDVSLVRRVLLNTGCLGLARLTTFKAPHRCSRRETAFRDLEAPGDPVLVGFAILAGIALAGVALAVVRW